MSNTRALNTRTTPATPMQLAAAGFSLEHGAAVLKTQRGGDLKKCRAAMRHALGMVETPLSQRLKAGLQEEAARVVGLRFGRVAVGMGCESEADSTVTRRVPPVRDHEGNVVVPGYADVIPTVWTLTSNPDSLAQGLFA